MQNGKCARWDQINTILSDGKRNHNVNLIYSEPHFVNEIFNQPANVEVFGKITAVI